MRKIAPYLNEKLNSSMQTPANNSDPKMNVRISRARTTVMDSDYWTVETIRKGTLLGDISVSPRRFKPYGNPNRIYEIHVENGLVKTAIREYPDRLKDGWQDQFSLGPGSAVSITFNGNWERHRELWRLVTEEKPWLFWIDNNNVLWRQLWDEKETKEQLATNVAYVKSIRAWKSVAKIDQDQGLVVGYIKSDGTVWYRNYCQQADYSNVWENERQLTSFTGVARSINLFISNDYRMGFVIEDSVGKIHWMVTPRSWSGMGIAPDYINARTGSGVIKFIPVTYWKAHDDKDKIVSKIGNSSFELLFGSTYNEITEIMNVSILIEGEEDWGWVIEFTVKNPISNLQLSQLSFIDIELGLPIQISSLESLEDNKYRVSVDNVIDTGIHNVFADIQATITGAVNPASYAYETFSTEFTPINLVPKDIPLPNVLEVWNE